MTSDSGVAIMGFCICGTIRDCELVVTVVIVFVLVCHHDLGLSCLHGQLRWLVEHGGADCLRYLVYQVSNIGIHLHSGCLILLHLLLLIHFQLAPF